MQRTVGSVVAMSAAVLLVGSVGLAAASATSGGTAFVQVGELRPSASDPAAGAGTVVAVSGDTVAVAAPSTTLGGQADEGEVLVYTKPASGWSGMTQTAVLTFPEEPFEPNFGRALAISGDSIVVGANEAMVDGHAGQGVAYVYTKPKTGWADASTPTATLTANDGGVDSYFGGAVAISGHTIVVGAGSQDLGGVGDAGAAYVFVEPPGGWVDGTQQAELTESTLTFGDELGSSVAVSGNTVVAGTATHPTSGVPGSGAAFVFTEPAGGWHDETETRELIAAHPATNAFFGSAVAVSGTTVVVAAPGEQPNANQTGSVYVVSRPRSGWGTATAAPLRPTATLSVKGGSSTDGFGDVIAVSGPRILAGLPAYSTAKAASRGAVEVYDKPAKGWASMDQSAQLLAAGGKASDGFGTGVAEAGATIVAGAPMAGAHAKGAAYVFTALPRPSLTSLKQSHASWRLGSHRPLVNPRHAPAGGTRFSFRLNEAARVTLVFRKRAGGHYGSAHPLTVTGRAGANRVYVDGPLRGKVKLGAGRYQVALHATNAGGVKSAARILHFMVRPRG
jgi:hypothetical protein